MNRQLRKVRRRARREEGAVMMIVMLILLTATALAGVAMQATEYELRAAGFGRSAVQTQYVSETAMVTTLSWVEALALDNKLVTEHLRPWNDSGTPPKQFQFGEPELLPAHSTNANRTTWLQQESLRPVTIPPITVKGAAGDPLGTFGPRVNYTPGNENPLNTTDPQITDYVVDMYDCQWLDGAGSPGSQVNQGGSGKIKVQHLYCVITSRGRSFLFGGQTRKWKTSFGEPYLANRFALAHDSRGTIVSPPIPR